MSLNYANLCSKYVLKPVVTSFTSITKFFSAESERANDLKFIGVD
jgi:hypothetical protein